MAIFKKNVEALESDLADAKENFIHAQEKCEEYELTLETLRGEMKTLQEELATKNSELEELQVANTDLQEKVATLEEEKVDAEKEIEAQLTVKLSELGLSDPVEEVADPADEPSLLEKFIELSGREKADFYAKHEAELKELIR